MFTPQPCSFFLIEDSKSDADLVIRVLKKIDKSVQIYQAQDGEQALKMLENWNENLPYPMVILLDWKLPKIDGMGVLQAVKQNIRLKSLPVIVLTSSNQSQDIQQAYYHGANSYIVKAIGFEEFSKTIEMIQAYWCRLNVHPT